VVHDGGVGEGGGHKVEEVGSTTRLNGLSGMAKYWLGKDYTNFIVKDFTNLDLPYKGNLRSSDHDPGSALPR
jgi:hypothetical protein